MGLAEEVLERETSIRKVRTVARRACSYVIDHVWIEFVTAALALILPKPIKDDDMLNRVLYVATATLVLLAVHGALASEGEDMVASTRIRRRTRDLLG